MYSNLYLNKMTLGQNQDTRNVNNNSQQQGQLCIIVKLLYSIEELWWTFYNRCAVTSDKTTQSHRNAAW